MLLIIIYITDIKISSVCYLVLAHQSESNNLLCLKYDELLFNKMRGDKTKALLNNSHLCYVSYECIVVHIWLMHLEYTKCTRKTTRSTYLVSVLLLYFSIFRTWYENKGTAVTPRCSVDISTKCQ